MAPDPRIRLLGWACTLGLLAAPIYLPLWWVALPSAMAQVPAATVLTQLVFHGTFATVVAGLLYTRYVTAIGPGPTTMTGAVVPALAGLIAWPALGGALSPLGVLAVLLVSGGMVLGVSGREDAAPRTPPSH